MSAPVELYKFLPLDHGPTVIESLRVRFSQVEALNDPFEFLCEPEPGVLRAMVSDLTRKFGNPLTLWPMAWKEALSIASNHEGIRRLPLAGRVLAQATLWLLAPVLVTRFYAAQKAAAENVLGLVADRVEHALLNDARSGLFLVFSCSETWESVPMWAHYASNHRGFVLGIDPRIAFFEHIRGGGEKAIQPRKVTYRDSAPKIGGGRSGTIDFTVSKMSHWSYEKEWRFLNSADNAAVRGAMVGGHELVLFDLNPNSITSITFGALCEQDTIDRVTSLLATHRLSPSLYVVRQGATYGFTRMPLKDAPRATPRSGAGIAVPTVDELAFRDVDAAVAQIANDPASQAFLAGMARRGPRDSRDQT